MLKVLYQKLRLSSKGNLNYNNYSNLSKLQLKETRRLDKVGRTIVQGIPVLSIFALVGIFCYGIIVSGVAEDTNGKAYAEEGITPLADTSASLIVDDGKIKDTIFAANGEFAYASHKITLEANNIKSYSLTLSKTAGLTGPSTIDDANGKTPDQMDNAWGYAFINDGADPTSATYQTLNNSNTLTGPAIDGNHNLSGSKQLVFGAKFGSSAMSGTYHAEATLSLVATPRVVTNYVVNVNCNSGTGCTSNLNTSSDAESYVYTISSTTPTRSGYKFLGYNTTNTTTANANYAPGKTVTLTAASPTLNLYAIWQQDIQTIKTITNMQQMTAAICAASAIGDTNTLTDTRDNSTYTVRKHEDGKCWMTQNLRLVGSRTLTPSDSNVSSNYNLPAPSLSGYNSNSYSLVQMYYSGNTSYGTYYSWSAANAGVCPRGWRLPSQSDYSSLATAIGAGNNASGSTIFRNNTYKFQYAGDIFNGSILNQGSKGSYWSSTALSGGTNASLLVLESNRALPTDGNGKYLGFSVRCVAYSS